MKSVFTLISLLFLNSMSFSYPIKEQNDSLQVDILIREGLRNFSRKPKLSIDLFNKSATLSSKIDYKKGAARSYHLMAQLLLRQGQQDSALSLLEESTLLYTAIADSISLGKVLLSEGDVFLQKREYEIAFQKYIGSLKILENQNDQKALVTIMRRMGDFLWKTDEDEKAMQYFTDALNLSKSMKDTAYMVQLYISMGNLSSKTKRLEQSLNYFDSVLSNQNHLSYRQKSAVYNSLGIVNYDSGMYEQALNLHLKSRELKEYLGDSVGLANTWLNLGNTFKELNKPANAEAALLKSLELAKRLNIREVIRISLLNLSRIQEENHSYQLALYYDNLYDSIDQLMFNEEKTKQLTQIREELDAEKREAEIKLLKKNEEIQKAESSARLQQRNYLIGATVLLMIIVGLVYVAYQQKKKSNSLLSEQNEIIARREKEKELLLHEVNHRVKNNLQMVSGLLRLQSHNLQDEKAAEAVKEGQTRVEALTLIHKKIFENSDHTKIITSEYFKELVENLLLSTALPIQSKMNLDDIELDVDQAVPVALIVNELITNALKYAFHSGKEGVLEFSLVKKGEEEVELSLQDNGDKSFNPDLLKESRSFGINLVYTLAAQLKGSLSLDNSNGTKWNLIFPQLK